MADREVLDVWVVVGLNKATRFVVLAGFSDDLTKANRLGYERQGNAEFPYDVWNEFRFDGRMGMMLHKWLRTNGMTKDESVAAVRQIGAEIWELLPHYSQN